MIKYLLLHITYFSFHFCSSLPFSQHLFIVGSISTTLLVLISISFFWQELTVTWTTKCLISFCCLPLSVDYCWRVLAEVHTRPFTPLSQSLTVNDFESDWIDRRELPAPCLSLSFPTFQQPCPALSSVPLTLFQCRWGVCWGWGEWRCNRVSLNASLFHAQPGNCFPVPF